MYSLTDPGLPYGESRDIHEFGGTGITQHKTTHSPISIDMIVSWIQDPVKRQYRQMCNEIIPIPNNI